MRRYSTTTVKLKYALALSCEIADKQDYIKRNDYASGTPNIELLNDAIDQGRNPDQAMWDLADEVIINSSLLPDNNPYNATMKDILNSVDISTNALGYVAYAPYAVQREVDKADKRQQRIENNKNNVPDVGNIGDRITVDVQKVYCFGVFEGGYHNSWGGGTSEPKYGYEITDTNGVKYILYSYKDDLGDNIPDKIYARIDKIEQNKYGDWVVKLKNRGSKMEYQDSTSVTEAYDTAEYDIDDKHYSMQFVSDFDDDTIMKKVTNKFPNAKNIKICRADEEECKTMDSKEILTEDFIEELDNAANDIINTFGEDKVREFITTSGYDMSDLIYKKDVYDTFVKYCNEEDYNDEDMHGFVYSDIHETNSELDNMKYREKHNLKEECGTKKKKSTKKKKVAETINEECDFKKGKDDLIDLRNQIVLGSIYVNDYENDLGYTADSVCSFFESYLNYLQELMEEDGYDDSDFFSYLPQYDTEKNLIDWYDTYFDCPFEMEEEQTEDVYFESADLLSSMRSLYEADSRKVSKGKKKKKARFCGSPERSVAHMNELSDTGSPMSESVDDEEESCKGQECE